MAQSTRLAWARLCAPSQAPENGRIKAKVGLWRACWENKYLEINWAMWRSPREDSSWAIHAVCDGLYWSSAMWCSWASHCSRMQIHHDRKWEADFGYDSTSSWGFCSDLHVALLLILSFLCLFVPLWLPAFLTFFPFLATTPTLLPFLCVHRKWWRRKLSSSSPMSWRFF